MRFVIALTLAAAATPAVAAPTIFFGEDINANGAFVAGGNSQTARDAFVSNLTGVGTENFEGIAAGSVPPINLTFPGSSGSITASLTGDGRVANSPGNGRFATSGTNFYQEVTTNFTISFSSPISAFGFYATDIGDFNGQVTLQLTGGSNPLITLNNTVNGPNASLLFFGFFDLTDTYTAITFGNTNAGIDFFGFDDLIIGDRRQVTPTPAPAAVALFGLGLAALGFRRR